MDRWDFLSRCTNLMSSDGLFCILKDFHLCHVVMSHMSWTRQITGTMQARDSIWSSKHFENHVKLQNSTHSSAVMCGVVCCSAQECSIICTWNPQLSDKNKCHVCFLTVANVQTATTDHCNVLWSLKNVTTSKEQHVSLLSCNVEHTCMRNHADQKCDHNSQMFAISSVCSMLLIFR